MDRIWPYMLGGFLNMLFWPFVLAVFLWLTRKWWPAAEPWLFHKPLSEVIALTLLRIQERLRA